MKTKLIDARKVHARHMAESPEYRAEYEGLEEEFALVNSMIRARTSGWSNDSPGLMNGVAVER